jgi:hypothetical protein
MCKELEKTKRPLTAPTSKLLAHILTPITIKTTYQVQDSLHLKHMLSQYTIPDTHILVSFDITNMYPSISRIPALAALRRLLLQDTTLSQRTNMTVDQIITLQKSVLCLTHFQWLSVFYPQTDGCAMGDPTSTPVSNAFMTEFETDVLARYRLIHDPPHTPPTAPLISVILFWFRQADDTMTAIHRDHVHVHVLPRLPQRRP